MATRRGFLEGIAAGSVLVGCTNDKGETGSADTGSLEGIGLREEEPAPWQPSQTEDRAMFPYGVRVGDVTKDAAIVAIYTTEETAFSAFQVQKAEGTEWIASQESTVELVEGHGQIECTGLESDTAYSIMFLSVDGTKRSQVSRFRTALSDEDWRIVTFGATSCMKSNMPWPNLTHAKSDQYDFFCLLGDTVYAYTETREGYWEKWDEALQQDGLYDLFSSTSVLSTWDDHELVNNFNWDDHPDEERFGNALWAFRRGLPQRVGEQDQIWKKISHGRVLDVFVLDCRGERRGDQYISRAQMDWLKDGLATSEARFKIIMNSVPIIDFAALLGGAEADDRWQGYPAQREEILGHIEDSAIEGVLWVSGDFHFGAICKVGAAGDVGDSQYEVMAGPSGSFINPIGLFVETEQYVMGITEWNHTRFVCNPETGEVLVQFVGDSGDVIEDMTLML